MNQQHPSRPAARPDQGLPFPPFPTPAEIQRHVAQGRMLRAETTAAILHGLGRSLARAVHRVLTSSTRRLAEPAVPQSRQA